MFDREMIVELLSGGAIMMMAALVIWALSGSMLPAATYYDAFPIPPRYDHQPTIKNRVLYEMSPLQVIAHCGWAYACTHMGVNSCTFYMPTGRRQYYWRHERAHCNGWPPNHPYP